MEFLEHSSAPDFILLLKKGGENPQDVDLVRAGKGKWAHFLSSSLPHS